MSQLPAVEASVGAITDSAERLLDWFRPFDRVTVAYSGGVDSALVLAAAVRALGAAAVHAVTARSPALPLDAWSVAVEVADGLGVTHTAVWTNELETDGYAANGSDRCYFCKSTLLDAVTAITASVTTGVIVTGTNADDVRAGWRPGISAAAERGARTPLADLGLTKDEVRAISRVWNLPTWSQPASPCLSSRIAYGIPITAARLTRVDAGRTGRPFTARDQPGGRVQPAGARPRRRRTPRGRCRAGRRGSRAGPARCRNRCGRLRRRRPDGGGVHVGRPQRGAARVAALRPSGRGDDDVIIDCHGHYTTVPPALADWRELQLAAWADGSHAPPPPQFDDDTLRASLESNQLKLARERGIDLTLFSPRASAMGHHQGDHAVSAEWTRINNDLIARVVDLYPDTFAGVGSLPQSPGVPIEESIPELRRCVEELGFVGCLVNPDPSGGHWTGAPLTDRSWYPLYEVMVELDVPAMVHVSASDNANFHATGAHYLNADTTAFMQFVQGSLFTDFPDLRFVIPHGGGAVPYHWGASEGWPTCSTNRRWPTTSWATSGSTPASTTSRASTCSSM